MSDTALNFDRPHYELNGVKKWCVLHVQIAEDHIKTLSDNMFDMNTVKVNDQIGHIQRKSGPF